MGKRFDVSDMPALTPEMQKRIGVLEIQLQAALQAHCTGYDLFDLEGAFEKARTFATMFYACYFNFYSQYSAYKAHWRKASETLAFQRVLTWISNFYAIRQKFDPSRLQKIKRTISDYADGTARVEPKDAAPSPVFGKQADAYARAGIDMASASPLLMEIHNAAQARRPNVWAPIPAEPKRRIPRSIHSEAAARRMEAHIQAKGVTQTAFAAAVEADERTLRRFRTSGKVDKSVAQRIANVMGITLDHFLS